MSLERKEILKWAAELEKLCGERATHWKPEYLDDGSFAAGFRIDIVKGVVLWTYSRDSRRRNRPQILDVFGLWEGLPGRGIFPLHPVRSELNLTATTDKDNYHRRIDKRFPIGESIAQEQWSSVCIARILLKEHPTVC